MTIRERLDAIPAPWRPLVTILAVPIGIAAAPLFLVFGMVWALYESMREMLWDEDGN